MNQHDDWWIVKEPGARGTVATIGFRTDRLKEWGHLLFLDLPNKGAYLAQQNMDEFRVVIMVNLGEDIILDIYLVLELALLHDVHKVVASLLG